MGTPEFAVPGLKILVENGYNVVAVITAPDKPQGRGLALGQSEVKKYALSVNLPVLQPANLKDEVFLEQLKAFKADLQIVVAFRMLPEKVWNMPPLGTFNLHASLLPQYRGAAPINWAIINGETVTGLTTFFLKHEIDTGDMILQWQEPILPTDNAGSLYQRLMHKGAEIIVETVKLIEAGNVKPIPQPTVAALKPAPKLFKEHGRIHWQKSAHEIHNLVRGLSPYPAAHCILNHQFCKVFEAEAIPDSPLKPAEWSSDGKSYIEVGTANGGIRLLQLQLEGKKRMDVKTFLVGNKVASIE